MFQQKQKTSSINSYLYYSINISVFFEYRKRNSIKGVAVRCKNSNYRDINFTYLLCHTLGRKISRQGLLRHRGLKSKPGRQRRKQLKKPSFKLIRRKISVDPIKKKRTFGAQTNEDDK